MKILKNEDLCLCDCLFCSIVHNGCDYQFHVKVYSYYMKLSDRYVSTIYILSDNLKDSIIIHKEYSMLFKQSYFIHRMLLNRVESGSFDSYILEKCFGVK